MLYGVLILSLIKHLLYISGDESDELKVKSSLRLIKLREIHFFLGIIQDICFKSVTTLKYFYVHLIVFNFYNVACFYRVAKYMSENSSHIFFQYLLVQQLNFYCNGVFNLLLIRNAAISTSLSIYVCYKS